LIKTVDFKVIDKMMTSKEIRNTFINFFKKKEHTFVKSAPVVPQDDPTLLFTNAGMNQFKDILLGKKVPLYNRAVNTQKCIRVSGKHNDLEEVGHDTYHHTFFEMLGNWSFGDYYKKEAISWAWELFTDVWKLPKEKLYATIFRDDDESAGLWSDVTDISKDHILRFDEKDNFWEMGETGPCGPCSEIHIDLGEDYCDKKESGHQCAVNGDCGRYIELWNLVFIQYNRDNKDNLNPLPEKHVDTGAGFERIVAVLQRKRSNYSTDLFSPILEKIGELANLSYQDSNEKSAFHVIADHVRMLSFSIADGAIPANEGRGYVMRRILRRAARYGRNIGMHEPFIYKLVPTIVEVLGETFPEIRERFDHISTVIRSEEEHFNRTLDRGLEIFEKIKSNLASANQNTIPGEEIFKLYDTYGFPVDLTRILADEADLQMDEAGFEKKMIEQQDRARKAAKFQSSDIPEDSWIILNENGQTKFVGYTEDAIETHLVRYSIHGDKLHIVLKDTPFYAESGGQVGDKGMLAIEGTVLEVLDTQKDGDTIIHICRLPKDLKFDSDRVFAELQTDSRRQTEKNHTATHLLHRALRNVLGEHVQQAGSLVAPDRLRFDFTHFTKIESEQTSEIERQVNSQIQRDLALEIGEDSLESAKARGAIALFGEKYDDIVRTVEVPNFSLELCGGTHVKRTGQIGLFVITYEGSIAAGIRRIEALTGREAVKYLQNARNQITSMSELLSVSDRQLEDKVKELLDNRKQLEKKLEKLSSKILSGDIQAILEKAETINDINVIAFVHKNSTMAQLKELGDQIRNNSKETVAVLGTIAEDKISFVCVVTDDLIKTRGLKAGELIKKVARIVNGGGGGNPHMATAGGKDISKFDEAMAEIKKLI
jgi:alanyl-tRNA synthetase